MGCMSASDAAPLPRLGEVFFDVRGSSRSMRLSWYSDTGVAVFSIWQGGTCTGTFRLPIDDLPRMVEALQRGPRGAALPAADGRDLTGDRPRRGIAGVPADLAVTSVGGFPDYATGQQIAPPVTGEFRSLGPGDSSAGFPGYGDAGARNTGADRQLSRQPSPAASLPGADSRNGAPSRYGEPSYAGDPLGSGSYPVYRDQEGPGAPFPGYADDGPPPPSAYRDPSPPSYRDDPLGGGAPSYRDDPLGGGSYRDHPSGPQLPLDAPGPLSPLGPGSGYREESLPGHRDSGPPYAGDPPGSGSYPVYRDRDPYPPSRDEPGTYPGDHHGQRYADDPFQSVYPDDPRDPAGPARPVGYPDGTRGGSHPYDLPPERPEQRAPRGRS